MNVKNGRDKSIQASEGCGVQYLYNSTQPPNNHPQPLSLVAITL